MDEKPIFLTEKGLPRNERGQNLRPEQFEALFGRKTAEDIAPLKPAAIPLNEWDVI